MMNDTQLLEELRALGTEQNCKIYKRHGVSDNVYGVSSAGLKALQKKIKIDHANAQKLWATGNHDARILATMIADPKQATGEMLEAWVHDLNDYVVSDAFAGYVSKTLFAREKMEQWTQSAEEWIGYVGWTLLSHLTMNDKTLSDDYFERYLTIIERDIHKGKNRVRYGMNGTVIAIGMRSSNLEQKALAAAERIGHVEVDHGKTGCKTPNAAEYIKKANARKK
jgi:3-methyladenine DNA glycosylase AlkD